MKQYLILPLLLFPAFVFCQWSSTLSVNKKVITKTIPFVTVDTGDVLYFNVSAAKNIPIKTLIRSFEGTFCDMQTQEQSMPDTTMDLFLVLKQAEELKAEGYRVTYNEAANTMLITFKLGDLSDCKGQYIWLKFIANGQIATVKPDKIEYKFFIKP